MKTETTLPRALTPNWVVVFLVIYWIWIFLAQRYLPQVLVFEILFVVATAAHLWWSGHPREIRTYVVGQWLPVGKAIRLGFVLVGALVVCHFVLARIQPAIVKQPTLELLLLAPGLEEVVFRGIVLTILLSHATAPQWAIILLGALMFAGCHVIVEPWRLLGLTIDGLIYGYALAWIRSVPFCVLCHVLKNAMTCCPWLQNGSPA